MDPNLLKHIEYFLEPNNLTGGDLDFQQQRPSDPTGASTPSTQNLWDTTGLNLDSGFASPSSAPCNFSFDSMGQTTPTPPSSARSQQASRQGSRVILSPRPPKSKAGHERKRTKLSTESTPFDNVDYWIQFDNDEGMTGDGDGSDFGQQKFKETQHQSSQDVQQQQQQQQRNHQQQEQQHPQRPKIQHSHTSPSTVPSSRDGQRRRPRPHGSSRSAAAGPSSSRPIHRSFRPEDLIEDDALDYALSEEGDITSEDFGSMNLADHMSGADFMPPADVPPREGLYSTPLSWEKPQPGLRLDSLMSMQNPQQLNLEEQRRLIAIAMNTGTSMGGLGSDQFMQSRGYIPGGGLHATLGSGINLGALGGFGGVFGGNFGNFGGFGALGSLGMAQLTDDAPLLRPDRPADDKGPQSNRSRSSTEKPESKPQGKKKEEKQRDDDGDEDEDGKDPKGKGKAGDRTAHNDIERKYRTNLKDKIAELRDAVPALRTIQEGVVDEGDDNGPGNRPKVSKGTVLTKATEYISELEKKEEAILAQRQQLSRRLAAFEQLLSQTAPPAYQMPNYSRTLFDPRAFC